MLYGELPLKTKTHTLSKGASDVEKFKYENSNISSNKREQMFLKVGYGIITLKYIYKHIYKPLP